MYIHPLLRIWFPTEDYIWIKVRFIHETPKAVLVYANGRKKWIPKARIRKIMLTKCGFEIKLNVSRIV